METVSTSIARRSELEACFEEAARTTDVVERCYSIAGHGIRLRYAAPALVERFSPALAHLPPATGPTELTISLWDSTGSASRPPLPEVDHSADPRGAIWISEDDDWRTAFQPSVSTFTAVDTRRGLGAFWTSDGSRLPWRECASPLRLALHWWMACHGHQMIHAGAVGDDRGGLLVVGRSGSGKSTTTLAAFQSGLRYASDDEVLVELDPVPFCHSIYNSGKLEAHHIRRFPALMSAVINGHALSDEKALVFVHAIAADRVAIGFPVRAVVLPRVVDQPAPRAREVGAAVGLRALAPSTLLQMPGDRASALRTMARLVERVPCYELELGADVSAIGPLLSDLLEELSGA